MPRIEELSPGLQEKLRGVDAEIARGSRLMELYRTDPKAFIEGLDLTPAEESEFKLQSIAPKVRCECCAVFFGGCGTGCRCGDRRRVWWRGGVWEMPCAFN